jgi:hypothetical protein
MQLDLLDCRSPGHVTARPASMIRCVTRMGKGGLKAGEFYKDTKLKQETETTENEEKIACTFHSHSRPASGATKLLCPHPTGAGQCIYRNNRNGDNLTKLERL